MSRLARLFPALSAGVLFLFTACGSEQPITTANGGGALRPGTAVHDAYPDYCTTQGTCTGLPGTEVVTEEDVTVCKKYPTGVNGPAIQVKLDVITHNVISSPTSLFYTIQPNTCLVLWYSNGGRSIPDTVKVQEIVPAGYTSTTQTATGKLVNGVFTSTPLMPSSGTTVNAITGGPGIPGVLIVYTNTPIPPALVSIGNFVWNDLNANGVQDPLEPGIPNVPVMLSNGATTVTDANGLYAFNGVPAGTYTVTVATPAGFIASPTLAGTPTTDSNGSGSTVTVLTGSDDSSDFGFYQLGSIGDRVWNDANGNGLQDTGEAGVSGVVVTLSGTASATTTTNASGNYLFPGLFAGSYTVAFTLPSGYTASPANAGSDITIDSNGASSSVAISGNNNLTVDFGIYKLGSIGDFVWNDADHDGIQDAGEAGFAGATVTLSGTASATTTTNALGKYLFSNLLAGTYTVTFTLPSGYTASPTNAGSDINIDSDGGSSSVVLGAGNNNMSVDYGIYPTVGTGTCAYTQGYWKNHEEKWPAPYSPTAPWMVTGHITPVTWDGLMGMSVTDGNSYMQLAHQWIAATLNRQTGAPMSAAVVTVLDDAKAWLILKTPSGAVPNFKDAQATSWASVLDKYNNGKLGTPHCN